MSETMDQLCSVFIEVKHGSLFNRGFLPFSDTNDVPDEDEDDDDEE